MDGRESLARLTEREKVCLRLWLQHKSAKEIAADLGISHHAVEKRLKIARTKLGATSSLEAARMLRDGEGYGQAVPQSPDLVTNAVPRQSAFNRTTVLGGLIMIFIAAVALSLILQPAAQSQGSNGQSGQAAAWQFTPGAVPSAGSEAALRTLVAGLASGSPDYDRLSPQFAAVVRRDLPMTHPLFSGMGELKSVTFLGRAEAGDDLYNLAFAKGGAIMSATIDSNGKLAGGILRPLAAHGDQAVAPTGGSEAALRSLVAGLASGSPNYDQLSPEFGAVVRRDLPMTHPLFSGMGKLHSATFLGRGDMGDDVYDLRFDKGATIMSAALDPDGRMSGGMFQAVAPPRR